MSTSMRGIKKLLDDNGIEYRDLLCGEVELTRHRGSIIIDDEGIKIWSGLGCEIDYGYNMPIKSAEHAMEVIRLLTE